MSFIGGKRTLTASPCYRYFLSYTEVSIHYIGVNIENNQRDTPLHIAFRKTNLEIVKLLLEFDLQFHDKDYVYFHRISKYT